MSYTPSPQDTSSPYSIAKFPADANDVLVYTFDESAPPYANTGTGGAASLSLIGGSVVSRPGIFPSATGGMGFGAAFRGTANDRVQGGSGVEPAFPITVSGWWLQLAASNGCQIFGKLYRPDGTFATPFLATDISLQNANGDVTFGVTTGAGVRTTITGTNIFDRVNVGAWNFIVGTYDGSNMNLYVNGSLAATSAKTGAIDYGTHGPWTTEQSSPGSGTITGILDEVRVANVVRDVSWIQAAYARGQQFPSPVTPFVQDSGYLFRWANESTTTPRVGAWSAVVEAGVTGASQSVVSTSGNHLEITQTAGDAGFAKRNMMISTNTLSTPDYTLRALLRPSGGTGNIWRYVFGVRVTSDGQNGYFLHTLGDGSNVCVIQLVKYVSGVLTALISGGAQVPTVFPGLDTTQQCVTYELICQGPNITVRLNGRPMYRVFDTSITSANGIAIGTMPAPTGNPQANAKIDEVAALPLTAVFASPNASSPSTINTVPTTVTTTPTTIDTTTSVWIINVGSASVINLPAASSVQGVFFTIKNITANTATLTANGLDKIDGSSTVAITLNQTVEVVSNGTNWYMI